MYINLCFWHLMKVPNTKQVQYQSLQVYPSNFPLVDLFFSDTQTQTCLVFKTVRLELCRKPIQKPNQFPSNRAGFSPKRNHFVPKTPKNGACSPPKRSMFFPTWNRFFPQPKHVFPKKTAHVFTNVFSRKRSFTKRAADFSKAGRRIDDRLTQNR